MNYTPIDFFRNWKKDGFFPAIGTDFKESNLPAKVVSIAGVAGIGLMAWTAAFNYAELLTHMPSKQRACEIAEINYTDKVKKTDFKYGTQVFYPLALDAAYGADLASDFYKKRNCQ